MWTTDLIFVAYLPAYVESWWSSTAGNTLTWAKFFIQPCVKRRKQPIWVNCGAQSWESSLLRSYSHCITINQSHHGSQSTYNSYKTWPRHCDSLFALLFMCLFLFIFYLCTTALTTCIRHEEYLYSVVFFINNSHRTFSLLPSADKILKVFFDSHTPEGQWKWGTLHCEYLQPLNHHIMCSKTQTAPHFFTSQQSMFSSSDS